MAGIDLRVLLTEDDLARELVSALRERFLPEKLFYWSPLSVRAWLALCADPAYRNFSRSRALLERDAGEIASLLGRGPLEVLSLGAGQGDKDLLLLEALRARGFEVSYAPVDASQSLLEVACRQAAAAGFRTRGIKADFTHPPHLEALVAEERTPPRLVLLVGNTLGAFDPPLLALSVRALLRPLDRLLVDGELHAGRETLAGYEHPANRCFVRAPLVAAGIGEADGELVFALEEDLRRPGLHRVVKHFRAARDLALRVGGEEVRLAAGEQIDMSPSYKYSATAFLGLLEEAGLRAHWQSTSDDGRFLMVLAAPTGGITGAAF